MSKTIMAVDDESSLLELIKAILGAEGYNVIAVSNGREALEKLKKTKPDLVLLDMMMPGMSGREVCEKIRADPETKDIKVAFLTVAKFSESGKGTLKKMGVSDYITKPFDNADLLKRIRNIIG